MNGSVKIEIEATDQYIEFRHSGKPFNMQDLISLIHQTSQKERNEVENDFS